MTQVIETGRTETIGKTVYRIEHHSCPFYGDYWGAVNTKTGRPHMMRETREEAEEDMNALALPAYNWE